MGIRFERCDWRRQSSPSETRESAQPILFRVTQHNDAWARGQKSPALLPHFTNTWEWENFILYLTSPRCLSATAVSHPAAGCISVAEQPGGRRGTRLALFLSVERRLFRERPAYIVCLILVGVHAIVSARARIETWSRHEPESRRHKLGVALHCQQTNLHTAKNAHFNSSLEAVLRLRQGMEWG